MQTFTIANLRITAVGGVTGRICYVLYPMAALAGVSLSGLFTLWQWMLGDTFRNIISLSGSYWYDGFVDWIKSRPVPSKTGRAYFLLGNQEAHSRVKAFQCVQAATTAIVIRLHAHGIDDTLDIVPGDHYQYPIPRLDRAFAWMFPPR